MQIGGSGFSLLYLLSLYFGIALFLFACGFWPGKSLHFNAFQLSGAALVWSRKN